MFKLHIFYRTKRCAKHFWEEGKKNFLGPWHIFTVLVNNVSDSGDKCLRLFRKLLLGRQDVLIPNISHSSASVRLPTLCSHILMIPSPHENHGKNTDVTKRNDIFNHFTWPLQFLVLPFSFFTIQIENIRGCRLILPDMQNNTGAQKTLAKLVLVGTTAGFWRGKQKSIQRVVLIEKLSPVE